MMISFAECTVEHLDGTRWKATSADGTQVAEFSTDVAPSDLHDRDDLTSLEQLAGRALAGEDAG